MAQQTICNNLKLIDPWFLIEWDGEDGNCTPVPLKQIINNCNPSEGDVVGVREARTKTVYHGVVLKRGKYISQCKNVMYVTGSKLDIEKACDTEEENEAEENESEADLDEIEEEEEEDKENEQSYKRKKALKSKSNRRKVSKAY